MLRRFAIAAALIATLAAPAGAQAPAQAPSADAATRMPAAMELVSVMRLPDFMRGMFPLIWQQMVAPLIARDDARIKEAVSALAPIIIGEMESELPRFGEVLARVYAEQFTAEELREITAFMRTPVGQSYIAKQATLGQASMTAGQEFGQQIFGRMRPRIEQELKRRLGQ